MTGKLCQSSSKWVPVSNQESIQQRKEKDGFNLPMLYPLLPLWPQDNGKPSISWLGPGIEKHNLRKLHKQQVDKEIIQMS